MKLCPGAWNIKESYEGNYISLACQGLQALTWQVLEQPKMWLANTGMSPVTSMGAAAVAPGRQVPTDTT